MNADAFFEGAAELGRIIAAQRAVIREEENAARQRRKDATNARRRARYAATKRLRPARTAVATEDDHEETCTCFRGFAPCSYCTTYDPDAEETA
ncbi:hypothetical protein [Catenuloplanes indicus]|uniref:Uncharacterized protein n=1 Tax=Catenuloplanes indicus TaxID=137267 RepID=A0AAE4AV62_9ACTN|nr:hypothetical protein [Catenuloplanes indicus]MDQ0363391.1 hypothetical protein [Catenuloplanes indicus]